MTGDFVQMWGDEAPFAWLFIEAAVHGSNGQGVAGSSLVGDHDEDTMGMTDSSEWTLSVNLQRGMIDAVLDQIADRGPRLREVVEAVEYLLRAASGPTAAAPDLLLGRSAMSVGVPGVKSDQGPDPDNLSGALLGHTRPKRLLPTATIPAG